MMKKIVMGILLIGLCNACVSKKVYQELESKYNKLRTANAALVREKEDVLVKNKNLNDQLQALQKERQELTAERDRLQADIESLRGQVGNLQESYDLLSSQSSKKIADEAARNKDLLTQLEEKERKLAEENSRLMKLEQELAQRGKQIDDLQALISAKEMQMQELKNAISDALHSFEGKGLTVEQRDGKIYVSMENKLLFSSGSWAVGNEGQVAVRQLADVLSKNRDINVLIEGHTDNVPYRGSTLLDNWDLSVKRATAIVRILKNNGVDPKQITAAGRSEFMPVATNSTSDGKAKNRRIEIILAPNLDAISKLLNE
jgi:chemotaxis protein MotB